MHCAEACKWIEALGDLLLTSPVPPDLGEPTVHNSPSVWKCVFKMFLPAENYFLKENHLLALRSQLYEQA